MARARDAGEAVALAPVSRLFREGGGWAWALLAGVEAAFPVVGLVGDVCLHSADTSFDGVELVLQPAEAEGAV